MMTDLGTAAYPSPPNLSTSPHYVRKPSSASPLYDHGAGSMASSQSPSQPGSFGRGADVPGAQDEASLNLNFLKTLADKRTTRDGNPPKRRGPKPDSKPALTRRQELNRQAQRTHRERKELYIKALEDEVLRLKEIYTTASQDKERLIEENRQLKSLLTQNGLSLGASIADDSTSNPSVGYPSSVSGGSYTGGLATGSSHTSAYTPPPLSGHSGSAGAQQMMRGPSPAAGQQHFHSGQQQQAAGAAGQPSGKDRNIDYDQAGVDFVLTLEKPCMDHLPWLLDRNTDTGGREPCGHALMASCPPEPFTELTHDIPFGYTNVPPQPPRQQAPSNQQKIPGSDTPQRTWELSKADLATLLDLSRRLNLDGEITPVMAWGMVLAHPRLSELRPDDFARITEELGGKVRCYGFGAVMEEFEVRDALENIFSIKSEPGMQPGIQQGIAMVY